MPFTYELSAQADNDLQEIFDYTADQFGMDQAVSYLNGFDVLFDGLCSNPKLGREREDVRAGLQEPQPGKPRDILPYLERLYPYCTHSACQSGR